MAEFVNFEAAKDNVDDFIDEEGEEVYENVSDRDFIDDENDFDENVEDYYAFTNISRRSKTQCKILLSILIILRNLTTIVQIQSRQRHN